MSGTFLVDVMFHVFAFSYDMSWQLVFCFCVFLSYSVWHFDFLY